MEISWLAVGVAAVSAFVLGGLWYGLIFAKPWQVASGLSDEDLKAQNQAKIFSLAFVLSLVAATAFGAFLGPKPELGFALGAGVSAGLCWVAASLGIIYVFESRPMGQWLINGGFVTMQFTLFGLVFAFLG
ncbi:MAG: DUF1761 domain-containing protein [Pseudomonadota bacterium]